MATRLVGVDNADPRLPDAVLQASTFGAAEDGVVPSSGGGTTNFLRADGTWAAPPGGGFTQDTADGLYVNTNGDTMTGALVLDADPSAALGAATKQYVDARVGGGTTMQFDFSTTTTAPPSNGQIRLNHVDQTLATLLYVNDLTSNGFDNGNLLAQVTTGQRIYIQDKNNSANWRMYTVSGAPTKGSGYTTVPVAFVASPTGSAVPGGTVVLSILAPTQASNDALYVNTAGDTMTGPLTLSGDPTANLHAATKQYVASSIAFMWDVGPEVGRWVTVGGQGTTTGPLSAGWMLFLPLRCPPCNFDALGVEVTTAGDASSTVRLGIYTNHATRIEPYQKLVDAGTTNTSTTGFKSLTFSPVAFSGGMVWLAICPLGSTVPQFRAVTGFGEPWVMFDVAQTPPNLTYRAWTVSIGSSAFPSTVGALGVSAAANPKIAFRTST